MTDHHPLVSRTSVKHDSEGHEHLVRGQEEEKERRSETIDQQVSLFLFGLLFGTFITLSFKLSLFTPTTKREWEERKIRERWKKEWTRLWNRHLGMCVRNGWRWRWREIRGRVSWGSQEINSAPFLLLSPSFLFQQVFFY